MGKSCCGGGEGGGCKAGKGEVLTGEWEQLFYM